MLLIFVRWWTARLAELVPQAITSRRRMPSRAIVVSCDADGEAVASLRRRGARVTLSLAAAGRLARRWPVILMAPAESVLVRRHVLPALPAEDMREALRHELPRITPFPAEAVYWNASIRTDGARRGQASVALTMVPKMTVEPILARLAGLGLAAGFIAAHADGGMQLLALGSTRPKPGRIGRAILGGACVGLLIAAGAIPILRQSRALEQVDIAIAALQPAVTEVETLQRGLEVRRAGHDVWQQEANRVGDIVHHLATLTRALPDDAFLTNLALRERRAVLNGEAGSAARLMTTLSADPSIQDAGFAAPVSRMPGHSSETFMIRAVLAP